MQRFAFVLAVLCLLAIAGVRPAGAAKDAVDSAIFNNESDTTVQVIANKAGFDESFCINPGRQTSKYYLFRVYSYKFEFFGRNCHGTLRKTIEKNFRQPHTVYTIRGKKSGTYDVAVSY